MKLGAFFLFVRQVSNGCRGRDRLFVANVVRCLGLGAMRCVLPSFVLQ